MAFYECTGVCAAEKATWRLHDPILFAISDFTGIHPGLLVMGCTIAGIIAYILAFKMLVDLAGFMWGEWKYSRGIVSLLWFIPLAILFTFLMILNIIHLVITLGAAYDAIRDYRDWWWRGSRR